MVDLKKLNVDELCKEADIVEVCDCTVDCKDSSEYPRRDYVVLIEGIDSRGRKKKYFFSLVEWEELRNEED